MGSACAACHASSPTFAFTSCSISSIAASVASWTARCDPRPEASICLRACCRIDRMAILASSPSFLTWRAVSSRCSTLRGGMLTQTVVGLRAYALSRDSVKALTIDGTLARSNGVIRMRSPCDLTAPSRLIGTEWPWQSTRIVWIKPMLIVPLRMPRTCSAKCRATFCILGFQSCMFLSLP